MARLQLWNFRSIQVAAIFGAFVQLDPTSTQPASGVGLGLHIVGRTVAGYGGSVSVNCADGRVTFTVRLPRVLVPAAVGV